MKDSECANIIKNIIQGVEYLTNHGIIHRDLKPENIMFRKENDINSLVLCDFGLAGEIKGNNLIEKKCGTLIYMAPEIIKNQKYDSLVDIWSVGIIMYILESGGKHPIYEHNMNSNQIIEFIKNKNKIEFPDFFPTIARNFFLKLCKYDPFFRYNTIKALNHPWIIRVNNKIPLTAIEDIEKEQKIKNFKNMLISMNFLKQLKYYFKNSFKRKKKLKINNIKNKNNKNFIFNFENNNKLNTPLLKKDKTTSYINSIFKVESNLERNNLPLLNKSISRDIINIMNIVKSTKSNSCIKQKINPVKLFSTNEKKNKIIDIKYILGYKKDINKIKSQKDIFTKIKHKNNSELLKDYNFNIKINPSLDNRNNLLKFNKIGKRIRLLSSDLKDLKKENKIFQKIHTPKSILMKNKKILKPIIPN